MKNNLYATFLITLLVVVGLGALHYLPVIQVGEKKLRKVDLLADLRPDKPKTVRLPVAHAAATATSDTVTAQTVASDTVTASATGSEGVDSLPVVEPVFEDSYEEGLTCIEDYADSTRHGMERFYQALDRIQTSRRPLRIAYFGDSFIEGDILTSDLRFLLQQKYGGNGVGYVPLTSLIAGFRPTVKHSFSGWDTHAVTDTADFEVSKQDISNRYYVAKTDASVTLQGQRKYASRSDTCEISRLYFLTPDPIQVSVEVNGKAAGKYTFQGDSTLQALSVRGKIRKVKWMIDHSTPATIFYGATLESDSGVILDNFSTRGSSGRQLEGIPSHILQKYNKLRPYDLIVIHYGLNVAFEGGVNYSYYKEWMKPVISKLKRVFPETSILIVGVGDRERKNENGDLETMPGVKNLIRYQQALAAETHVAFWNLFNAMGGEGSMVEMVDADPPLANYDYTHINFRGGKHIAGILFEALMHGKEQYDKQKAYEME